MTKLEKIGADLEKARMRLEHWEQRVKHLEERYSEEENTVIFNMVHAANLTPEMLANVIKMATQCKVGIYPVQNEQERELVEEIEDSIDEGMDYDKC